MAIEFSPTKLERPVQSEQSIRFDVTRIDESYFDKLLVFGLACLAAAIVGKLTMAALTPQYKKDICRTL
jgi:hypothetical protein